MLLVTLMAVAPATSVFADRIVHAELLKTNVKEMWRAKKCSRKDAKAQS